MIVVPDGTSGPSNPKPDEANPVRELHIQQVPVDAPPPYIDSQEGSSTSHPVPPPSRILPNIKSSNFVCLSRQNDSVKGSWIIDPSMVIPSAFLPSLSEGETEETRSNISLMSRNGAIDAEIFILQRTSERDYSSPTMHRKPVTIRASSHNGSVTLKIHSIASHGRRLPIRIKAFSANGSVHIYIPRSFQGPVSVALRNGSLRHSDSVGAVVTQFSELDGMQRSFIGDFDANAIQDAGDWVGDMLSLESRNGSAKIYFDDELDACPRQKSTGFFQKYFCQCRKQLQVRHAQVALKDRNLRKIIWATI